MTIRTQTKFLVLALDAPLPVGLGEVSGNGVGPAIVGLSGPYMTATVGLGGEFGAQLGPRAAGLRGGLSIVSRDDNGGLTAR
jgi:hypothetical protein